MKRRLGWIVLLLGALAGCNSSSTSDPGNAGSTAAPTSSSSSATYADPAAQVAQQFLEAVVAGDTERANALLTPLAVEQIVASGKPFQLPGLANYTFHVGQVRHPSTDKAFVQCTGTDRSAEDKPVDEEFCWLMSQVGQDWRIAGISYTAGPQQTLMIYSFENPEKGAIPVQQLMAQPAGQSAASAGPQSGPRQSPNSATKTPQTAQEGQPAGAYR